MRMRLCGNRRFDFLHRRLLRLQMADRADRCMVACTHARRANDAHIAAELARQFGQQPLGSSHGAGQGITHPHRHRRRRGAVLHHVEMRIEGRDLVHLGQRHAHQMRERGQMRRGEMAVFVLDQMQMLDQQIAAARPFREQRLNLGQGGGVNLPALRRDARTPPPRSSAVVLLPPVRALRTPGWIMHIHERSPSPS